MEKVLSLNTMPSCRFATVVEVFSEPFTSLWQIFDRLTVQYNLPDHRDVNLERYPWAANHLSVPSLYAARMWEYPFALISADLTKAMTVADVGCGMTSFTVYLQEMAHCQVVGIDPDIFDGGIKYKGHGVSHEFIRKTGLSIIQSGMESLPLASESFDRVFCLSVIEHLPAILAQRGIQEMVRILKPGGRLIVTVDVNLLSELCRPLDLIWESGLFPLNEISLRWPEQRFGVYCDGKQPADVYGMTLVKNDYAVDIEYRGHRTEKETSQALSSFIPRLRYQHAQEDAAATQHKARFLKRLAHKLMSLLR